MNSEQVAKNWRADVYRLAWLRMGVRFSVGYLLVWGMMSLAIRGFVQTSTPWLWWGGAGLVVVWVAASVMARRQVPSPGVTLAMLDRENRLGGLLMSGSATGREGWAERLPAIHPPRVRWRGTPTAGALGLSAVFVLAALLVPMPSPLQARDVLDVSQSIALIEQQVDVLEEEQIFDAPEADQIRDAMDRIGQDAKGDDPSKTWEALDHLAQQIDQAADEATDLAQQRMEEAAGVQVLSQALLQDTESLNAQRLGEAMATLAELSEAAAGQPTLDGMELPPGLAEALSQSGLDGQTLTPEMLEQLAEAMSSRQAELQQMIEALAEAGLSESSGSEETAAMEIDPSELLDWLVGDGECDGQGLLAVCQSLRAGRGGISPGPGHAEMIWKDPSSREGVRFDPELLPPSRMRELRDAQMLGTSRGTPDEIQDASSSAGGALSQTQALGGSAAESVVLPRHRGAVQRYFDRGVDDE
ncbi:MAG: hypothetical protein AAF086_05825 [Planctomycetota bacterium]